MSLTLAWWLACYTIYAIAWPIGYTRHNYFGVTSLMAATIVCTYAGFRIGVGRAQIRPSEVAARIPNLIWIGFATSLVLVIPLTLTYSGFAPQDILRALTDQSAAYARESQRIAQGFGSRSAVVVVETLVAPLTMSVLPFLAWLWFEKRAHLWLFAIALFPPVFLGLLGGRSVGIGLSAVVVFAGWILSRARRGGRLRWREAGVMAILVVAALGAFGEQKLSRYAGAPICPAGSNVCTGSHSGLLQGSLVIFSSYASQGFEGLGHALDAHWTFGGGFSHSVAVQAMVVRIFHVSTPHVVTAQLTSLGWSDTSLWSTALSSIANDVPWPLVPLVIGIQAAILGASWRSSVERPDWLANVVFAYTWIALLFVPQNLQLSISGPVYLGYIALVVLYVGRPLLVRWRLARIVLPMPINIERQKASD